MLLYAISILFNMVMVFQCISYMVINNNFTKLNLQVEKRKSFHVFLKQFLTTYKNWEPIDSGQLSDSTSLTEKLEEQSIQCDRTVMGCSVGHPAEVILAFSEELVQLTTLVTECKS